MKIYVVAGTGFGPTELAAFDAALNEAGVADRNLIRLSSVIPPSAEVMPLDGVAEANGEWGDKLYAVMAQQRTSHHGTEVWAGIGWIQFDADKGLFVEHEGHSRAAVERSIRSSLMALMKNRGKTPDESLIQMKVVGTTCQSEPACALVVAMYSVQGW